MNRQLNTRIDELDAKLSKRIDEVDAKLTKRIDQVNDNLSKRIAVAPTGDELERMGRTWNEVLERLDLAVQRIRRFTADASHELRTPLSLIRASADLALRKERDAGEYQGRRRGRVLQRVQVLAQRRERRRDVRAVTVDVVGVLRREGVRDPGQVECVENLVLR